MTENLDNFIKNYNLENIKLLKYQDKQFIALKSCRNNIKNKDINLFLFLIIQCALISYQISGGGELRRTEFSKKIEKDRQYLLGLRKTGKSNNKRRYSFLTTSKYNKRIYNIKTKRLEKFDKLVKNDINFTKYKNNLLLLQTNLSETMKVNKNSKTIVFSIKMYGYAYEIISGKTFEYPMSIEIPVDSRLKKIYEINTNLENSKESEIQNYFHNLSTKYQISPLDLDTVLRLDYRYSLKLN